MVQAFKALAKDGVCVCEREREIESDFSSRHGDLQACYKPESREKGGGKERAVWVVSHKPWHSDGGLKKREEREEQEREHVVSTPHTSHCF